VTASSWSKWEADIQAGLPTPWLNQLLHMSTRVRYPAEGMAYVVCVIAHPDQDEPFTIEKEGLFPAHVITLLWEQEAWKVHQVGGDAVPPHAVGKKAFSW